MVVPQTASPAARPIGAATIDTLRDELAEIRTRVQRATLDADDLGQSAIAVHLHSAWADLFDAHLELSGKVGSPS
jgi:hypothetical protein